MTEIVSRIINYTAEFWKCFLCDRKFTDGDLPWNIFEKRIVKNGQTDCPLSAILSSALGKQLVPDAVHSKALCDECNFIILEFDSIERRLRQFRLEILADYNNTAKVNGLEPIVFRIKEVEECARIYSESEAVLDRNEVKTECEGKKLIIDQIPIPNNQAATSYAVNVQAFNVEAAAGIKNDPLSEEESSYAEQNAQVIGGDNIRKPRKQKRSEHSTNKKQQRETNAIDFEFTEPMYICALCPEKSLYEPMLFSNHLKIAHDYNFHVCYICCKGFSKENEIKDHMDKVHLGGTKGELKCKTCQQVFSNHHLFRIHRKFHYESLKKYECCACNKKYLSQKLLDEHMNMHIGNRPYKCMLCDKDFASKYTLKAHNKTHTKRRKQYRCDVCTRTYLNKSNLMNHKKLH